MGVARRLHLPGGEQTLQGRSFDWVHVYAGKPVPPADDGSFNFLLWEILQQHGPRHLLVARDRPGAYERAQGTDTAIAYLDAKERVSLPDRVRQLVAGTQPDRMRDFSKETVALLREVDADKVVVWGSVRPLGPLRWAFPDKTIVYAQRYYEVAHASDGGHYGYCDFVLTQSEGTSRHLFAQNYSMTPTLVPIPNGVDLDRYRPLPPQEKARLRERLGLPLEKTVVIFPSKIDADKGTSYLRHWIQQARTRLPDVFFVVAGGLHDALRGDVKRLVQDLETAPNARWLKGVPRNDMPPWYQAADVSLMPSVCREGMSMAATESLASGLPVIATERGFFPEIVFHDHNGLLCRPEALLREGLDAIEALARDPKRRERMSLAARAYAERRLPRRRCLDNFRAFFEGRLHDIDATLTP